MGFRDPYNISWSKPEYPLKADERTLTVRIRCENPETAGWLTGELRCVLDHLLLIAEEKQQIAEHSSRRATADSIHRALRENVLIARRDRHNEEQMLAALFGDDG